MKIIKLTETDLKKIIERVLNENSLITESDEKESRLIEIQNALKKLKYNLGTTGPNKDGVDGKYGRLTKIAIADFQTKNKIRPTGWVGTITAPVLGVEPMIKGTPFVGKPEDKKEKSDEKKQPSDVVLSKNADLERFKNIKINDLSTKDSVPICKAGQDECAQFVGDFSKKIGWMGSAWYAHNIGSIGQMVFDSYRNLDQKIIGKIVDLYKKIHAKGGGVENGEFMNEIRDLQYRLVPKTSPIELKLDDVVGIFYPPSKMHEKAFYQAGRGPEGGKGYFITDKNGKVQPGKTLTSGEGFGMNTHLGIVGAVKDGVPLIFHNIHGQVYSDPQDKIRGGGRIAWVRRP